MKWILTLLAVWLVNGSVLARPGYWDADYDSLARVLPRQRTDSARLHTVVHLLDLHPTNPQALPLLDQLLTLNQHLQVLNDAPYRRLRVGLVLWQRGSATASALDSMKVAVAAFDRVGRPIPWLLIDLVTLYNQANRMAARKQYYDEKLTYYQLRGATENVAACYVSQGGYYRRMGDYNRTLNSLLRAADLVRGFDHRLYVRELVVAGDVYADWGNRAKAVYYLRLAQSLPGFRRLQGMERLFTFLALSRLYAEGRDHPSALRMADSALVVRVADPHEQQVGRAYALVRKSAVLLQMQQVAPVAQLLKRAQQIDDSLGLPMAGKPGEFEIDFTWARYYEARHNDTQAEIHWLLAYKKASEANLNRLLPRYLQYLAAFYDASGRPVQAERYSRAYIAMVNAFDAAQSIFHVAQYESERVEQAQNEQINNLRRAQVEQAARLRLRNRLLGGAVLAVLLVLALVVFIYRQLHVNRHTLAQLRQTQSQLVQVEKMAFLGELTAGIAHELQNPLNFVKNFAEVSTDLVDEMSSGGEHRDPSRNMALEREILAGLKQNLQQISQHGQRATSIIKGMLEHSRTGTSEHQPTDLNALVEDSLHLAYQGLQAKEKGFTAQLTTAFAPGLPPATVAPLDMSRVLINLFTNAFHAVQQRQRQYSAIGPDGPTPAYQPEVTVTTAAVTGGVEIRIRDNGTGMADKVKARIFQPFFTTKAVGEGTGLGLSLSHDVVTTGHGGSLTVQSREGEGTEFIVALPV